MLTAVPNRERHRDRGLRRAREDFTRIGHELRQARHAAGLHQRDVARAAGVSSSWVSRIGRGVAEEAGLQLVTVLAAVVSLDPSVRAYAGGQPLRDEAHRQLLARIRALLPPDAPWQTEVPLHAEVTSELGTP